MTVITETLKLLPPHAKKELADFAEFLAQKYLKSKIKNNKKQKVVDFAGCWENMNEGDYTSMLNEIYDRREKAVLEERC